MVNAENLLKSPIEFEVYPPHLRLFQREALRQFRNIKHLLTFTNRRQREYLDVLYKQDQFDRHNQLLFQCVSYAGSTDAATALRQLISKDTNQEVQKQLRMAGLRTYEYVLKLYWGDQKYMMDRMVNMLEPEPIIKYLQGRNCREYDHLIWLVNSHLEEGRIEDAACELVRGLPYCSDAIGCDRKNGEWYYDFLEACLTHPDTRMLPRFLDKDYKESLRDFRAAREVEHRNKCSADLYSFDTSNTIIDPTFVPKGPRSQNEKDYSLFRQSTVDYSDIRKEYVLYTYQRELVSHARNGRNTIVCAPTGSGKTIVATDIMFHHLEAMKRANKVARVIMLVPTVPLVDQQTVHLVSYMINKHWVDGISGVEPSRDRLSRILASDVVVITPQIFINMLNSVIKQEKLYFQDFTMLIFDECHHAGNGENHPYKILLEMFQEQAAGWKPQIIGLTASVGVGKTSFQIHVAKKHILELCSIMMADSISTVRKYLDDLKERVPPPVDEMERAKRPTNDEFIKCIKQTMRDIQVNMCKTMERVLEKQPTAFKREDFDFLLDFKMIEQGPQYQAKVGILKKLCQRIENSSARTEMIRSADHLAHYFHTMGVADLLPNKYALDYLNNKMQLYSHYKGAVNGVDEKLLAIYMGDPSTPSLRDRLDQLASKENVQQKEILIKLYNILLRQYKEKPQSRTLIFVSTRTCAQKLAEHLGIYLSQCKSLNLFCGRKCAVGFMTSSNQSASTGGQSADNQQDMVKRFARGDLKILVVTSVAEEGINIAECNLIIKYNNVGSETTLIQRRGRARAKDSRAILLALDSGVEHQEYENIRKERMMMDCIRDLQAQTEDVLRMMITQKTEELRQEKERKNKEREELYRRLQMRKYNLKCRNCNQLISESMDIRSVANTFFVCCNKNIWKISRNEIHKRPTKMGLTINCARWLCNKCDFEWGTIVKYSNAYLPALKAKAFLLERIDLSEELAEPLRIDTWTSIQKEYFNIDPITMENITKMLHALRDVSKDDKDKWDRQEMLANQLEIQKHKEKPDRRFRQQVLLEE